MGAPPFGASKFENSSVFGPLGPPFPGNKNKVLNDFKEILKHDPAKRHTASGNL
jgi:hypothetical protein